MTDPRGVATSKGYDARGNVVRVTDGGGFVSTAVFNPLNLPTSKTDVRGHTTTMAYDPQGRLLATTDPIGAVTNKTYDAAGRNLVAVDATGRTTGFEYRFDFTTPLRTTYADGSQTLTIISWLDQPVVEVDSLGSV